MNCRKAKGYVFVHDTYLVRLLHYAQETKEIYDQIRTILAGQESVSLYLEFLKRNNKVDMLILKNTKDVLEPRSSIYHTALSLQNAFMHAGTTSDVFLRENLEWLVLANNWSKFSAAAAIGVIHKGHFQESMNILGPYHPAQAQDSATGANAYMEGGALTDIIENNTMEEDQISCICLEVRILLSFVSVD